MTAETYDRVRQSLDILPAQSFVVNGWFLSEALACVAAVRHGGKEHIVTDAALRMDDRLLRKPAIDRECGGQLRSFVQFAAKVSKVPKHHSGLFEALWIAAELRECRYIGAAARALFRGLLRII